MVAFGFWVDAEGLFHPCRPPGYTEGPRTLRGYLDVPHEHGATICRDGNWNLLPSDSLADAEQASFPGK